MDSLWGAIGGTIPDLDVFANAFFHEIDALAMHRGISHSFFFSILAPLVFGWLTYKLYDSGTYQKMWYKIGIGVINLGLLFMILSIPK